MLDTKTHVVDRSRSRPNVPEIFLEIFATGSHESGRIDARMHVKLSSQKISLFGQDLAN
jgi:hypothetical protein